MRQMQSADIEAGLRFCRSSGWNQLAADWGCFLRTNPEGCRVAMEGAHVAGTVTTLRFQDRFAWISMLLVAPELRGRGIGTALLTEALRVLEGAPCIRLDATPAGKQVYDKYGFHDEYPLVRMRAERVTPGPAANVRRMAADDLAAVFRLDREVFGADRQPVLDHLRESAPEYAFVIESAGQISGFAFGRHGFRAEHIGPVVARDAEAAGALVSASVCSHSGTPFLLDATEHSPTWQRWLAAAGFRKERAFMRMFRGHPPQTGRPELQFAIAGPEFG